MTNKAKSLYIHIPFCNHICDYCDFPKLQYFRIYAEKYIDTLIEEIESFNIHHTLETIYIGGGTPTALEDDLLEKLLSYLVKYVNENIEYTIETNPETLTPNKVHLLKKYKINRVSIGVESTNDKILKAINRKHTFEDVKKCVSLLKENKINNLAIDLILGLPNVSLTMLKKDVENVLSLGINHISCYSLSVHPNTVFGINKIEEPTPDFARSAYDLIDKILSRNHFEHYEISSWCLDNKKGRHNLTYWSNDRYYGAGLGAAGYLENYRYKNTRNILAYNNKLGFMCEKEYLTNKDERDYAIMLNLRTSNGINLDTFKNRYNEDLFENYSDIISELIEQKLLIFNEENKSIIPTYEGMMILDTIILKFI